mgnify:CR=1 FL=1
MPKLYKLKWEGIAYYFGSWDNMNLAIDRLSYMNLAIDRLSSNEGRSRRDLYFMQLADFAVDTKTNKILKARGPMEDLLDTLT